MIFHVAITNAKFGLSKRDLTIFIAMTNNHLIECKAPVVYHTQFKHTTQRMHTILIQYTFIYITCICIVLYNQLYYAKSENKYKPVQTVKINTINLKSNSKMFKLSQLS